MAPEVSYLSPAELFPQNLQPAVHCPSLFLQHQCVDGLIHHKIPEFIFKMSFAALSIR
jgi:hypothetical protein